MQRFEIGKCNFQFEIGDLCKMIAKECSQSLVTKRSVWTLSAAHFGTLQLFANTPKVA